MLIATSQSNALNKKKQILVTSTVPRENGRTIVNSQRHQEKFRNRIGGKGNAFIGVMAHWHHSPQLRHRLHHRTSEKDIFKGFEVMLGFTI